MRVAALIMAAGKGARVGGRTPKQYLPLGGRALLRHSVERFGARKDFAILRCVIGPGDRSAFEAAAPGREAAIGGASRQQSVRQGLESLVPLAPDLVLIHDAARPLVDDATIDRVLDALRNAPGAMAALPVVDSLRLAAEGLLSGAVARDNLWRAQTPQGFRFPDILAAHRAAAGLECTDDAEVALRFGLDVRVVAGSEDNFKVTTPDDLTRAERILASRLGDVRVGSGFDVHRFGPGERVMLCGVAVPHHSGAVGHSDADVGLHALTDALLGALGEGDIGEHFPPSDVRWKGQSSDLFLRHAASLVASRGGVVAHVDVTLLCETPKVAPHRQAMRQRIAEILGLDAGRVSVKATTTEKLGFLGRGEGIAAQAIATVRLPAA